CVFWLGIVFNPVGSYPGWRNEASDSTRPTELSDLFGARCVIKEVMELHHAPCLIELPIYTRICRSVLSSPESIKSLFF
ncbi:MAG: hypothetical protein OXC07_07335, partial [Kistimonas sp.]|nr:hypothetical protein [Kistimonas sp.]